METFKTDAGYTLEVYEWDRDGELMIDVDNGETTFSFYLSQAQIKRLRNYLSIQLGDE